MKPTPFDTFVGRIGPHRGVGRNLARQFGVEAFWRAGSMEVGAAAIWGIWDDHFRFDPAKPPLSTPDVFNIRYAFSIESPFRRFHEVAEAGLRRKQGDSAFSYANSMMGEHWSYFCHYKAGERVYEVAPPLAALLARTELRGVHGADLQLPYKSIYIGLPPSAGLKDLDGDVVQGFFVTQSVLADPHEKPGKSWWIMTVAGEEERLTCFFFNLDLLDEEPVEDALKRKLENVSKYPSAVKQAFSEGLGPNFTDQFRWVMNVVLYATHHPDADLTEYDANKAYVQLKARAEKAPKGSEKRKRLYAELKDLRPCRRILLGRSVSHDPEPTGRPGESRPLRVRTLVAGHWRNQAHGEGRALRKLIWIRPFWRGPEDVPELNPRRVLALPSHEGSPS